MSLIHEIVGSATRVFNSNKTEAETKCDLHFHNELELFYLCEGYKIFYAKNQTFRLEKGDIIFVNGRVPHKTYTPVGSQGILIQFKNSLYLDKSYSDEGVFLPVRNNEVDICIFPANTDINRMLYESIQKISREHLNKDKFYNMYIKSYIYEILACLCRYSIIAPNALMDKKNAADILPVLDYINKNYSKHIRLDDVSNLIHIEKSYFCKLFKRAANVSFLDYLNYIRIYHAEILLRETNKSVTQISEEVGFSSASYFAETFRKINSLSPTAYRNMISSDNF